MNRLQLLSTVAASLLLAAGTAAAQGLHEQKMPERAPAAQRHAPAEKIAPSMHAGEHKMPQTTGQGSSDESRMSGEHTGVSHDQRGAEQDGSQSSMRNGGKASTSGEGSADNEKRGGEKPSITEHQSGKNGGEAQMKRGEESQSKSGEETHGKTRVESKGEHNGSTTGQGAAAGAAKLSTEQRTKITTIIKKKNVEPTHLNISVHVGARVPAHVHFYPLPPEVVTVYPEWRGYDYVVVGDQILVIDPDDHEIVAILNV